MTPFANERRRRRARSADSPRRWCAVALACIAWQGGALAAADLQLAQGTPASLSRLSIEELAEIEISSVSRRPERLADAAASVYVITSDDIRRSGAGSLPEALRLAPNLQVARTSSNSYAITARGFNSESANKLLVMIDGRTVYTPLHSGVFWDVQDVMMSDIDRIEVVSGPGGTLWGANAVNGVINVITRSARDTTGSLVNAGVGNEERSVAARHGWPLGGDAAVRAYVREQLFDASVHDDGSAVDDAWRRRQAGVRADGGGSAAAWTLQGDFYDGEAHVPNSPLRKVSGGNVLARFSRELDAGSGLQVQAYVDSYRRSQPGFFTEYLDTLDLDAQHHMRLGATHELVWGGGIRSQRDRTSGGAVIAFVPADSRLTLASLFAQDTVSLNERIKLTVGLKAEHNSYTGVEYQPNVRLAWKASEQALFWAAVSRAVRTPSRLDRDLEILVSLGPPYNGRLLGGSEFMSERVTAYEAGYRGQFAPGVSFSVSAFINDYSRLRSVEPNGSGDFILGNGVAGRTQGLEAWGSWQAQENWRLNAGLSLLHESLHFTAGSADPGSPSEGSNDPRYQASLRSSWTLPHDMSLDLALRRVGALPNPVVPAYTGLDLRLAWSPSRRLQVSLGGLNLLERRHAEFGAAPGRSDVERSIMLRLVWAQ